MLPDNVNKVQSLGSMDEEGKAAKSRVQLEVGSSWDHSNFNPSTASVIFVPIVLEVRS